METCDLIIDGLYLGGVMSALNELDLQVKKITHILSLDNKPLPLTATHKLTYKHVYALDMDDFDLISCFTECFTFIDQAIDGHCSVLVHCQAGMSRSASVVVGYLMYKQQLDLKTSLQHVTSRRPQVRPNYGFMEQLELLESMGGVMDRSHIKYRTYQLNKLALGFQSGKYAQGVPEQEVPAEVFVQPDYSGRGGDAYYKCRKCRIFLFHSGAITQHNIGSGDAAFDWRSKIPANQRPVGGATSQEEACLRSLFVSPLVWMKGKINSIVGKLHCPKCDAKIGSYVWYGEKCPCGAWVAPAFHIDAGKVDKIPSQPVLPRSSNIVRPFSVRSAQAQHPLSSGAPPRPHDHLRPGPSRPISQLSEATTAEVAARNASANIPSSTVATVSPMPVVAQVVAMSSASVSAMDSDNLVGAVGGVTQEVGSVAANHGDLESGISSMRMDTDS